MRLYESVFIARQDISTTQVESMADEFAGIITNAGGTIYKREYWACARLPTGSKRTGKAIISCSISRLTARLSESMSGSWV